MYADSLWEYCYQSENDGDGYWMGSGYKVTTKVGTIKIAPWTQVLEFCYVERFVYHNVPGPFHSLKAPIQLYTMLNCCRIPL